MLIKQISQFSNTGWRTDNFFAGFHVACSRLSAVGASEKGGRARKKGGDSLGSWERAKRADERGKKRGDSLGSWG